MNERELLTHPGGDAVPGECPPLTSEMRLVGVAAVGSDLRMMVQKSQETLKIVMPNKVGGELARY